MSPHHVEIRRNCADASAIAAHLRSCDASFVPPLLERVDVDAYASKIASNAERFEAWSGGRMAGLVAAYCNDPRKRVAFVTNVSVLPECQGRGIASLLLQACVEQIRDAGFDQVELEVDNKNAPAMDLYLKHGFKVVSIGEHNQTMHLIV